MPATDAGATSDNKDLGACESEEREEAMMRLAADPPLFFLFLSSSMQRLWDTLIDDSSEILIISDCTFKATYCNDHNLFSSCLS